MKLTKLLSEKVHKVGEPDLIPELDPESGEIHYKVNYGPLRVVDAQLDHIAYNLTRALSEYPDDIHLDSLVYAFLQWKKNYRTHIGRKYRGKR